MLEKRIGKFDIQIGRRRNTGNLLTKILRSIYFQTTAVFSHGQTQRFFYRRISRDIRQMQRLTCVPDGLAVLLVNHRAFFGHGIYPHCCQTAALFPTLKLVTAIHRLFSSVA